MTTIPHSPRDPHLLPVRGRCSKSVLDTSLKVKARRHEPRKIREEMRHWIAEGPIEALAAPVGASPSPLP